MKGLLRRGERAQLCTCNYSSGYNLDSNVSRLSVGVSSDTGASLDACWAFNWGHANVTSDTRSSDDDYDALIHQVHHVKTSALSV